VNLEIIENAIARIDGRKDFYTLCLVGYTNAGKSTLLNALTRRMCTWRINWFAHSIHGRENGRWISGMKFLLSDYRSDLSVNFPIIWWHPL